MKKFLVSLLSFGIIVPFFSAGCSLTEPINDFQQGPVGMIEETSPDTASWTADAPTQLYDIEGLAGGVFEGVLSRNWNLASTNLSQLITAWTEAKSFLQDPQNNLETENILNHLITAVQSHNADISQQDLNNFMYKISDISKNYKLSPLSDIIAINNAGRDLRYAVENKNWATAATKIKELQNTWGRAKSNLEQFGILGEITHTHSSIEQMKNSVDAENKTTFLEKFKSFNESMAKIRSTLANK